MTNRDKSLDSKILKAAKEEFSLKGYREASLRKIGSKAGVTTGAIYTRYSGKEELFYEVCKDTILAMEAYFKTDQFKDGGLGEWMQDLANIRKSFSYHANLISQHTEYLDLLLFKSSGSDYENYRESLIEDYIDFFSKGLVSEKGQGAFDHSKSTTMVLRTIASCYVAYIEELVLYAKEEEALKTYIDKVAVLVSALFKALINYEK